MYPGIYKTILRWCGWKIVIPFDPAAIPQSLVVVMPHTSSWDFPVGLLVRGALKWKVNFIAKDSLFKGMMGSILRRMGGYPVDRSVSHNFTSAVVDLYHRYTPLHIAIAPEGTRSKVDKLKSGFYYIARQADIPVIFTALDFRRKEVVFAPPQKMNQSFEEEMKAIADFYKDKFGKHPEKQFDFSYYQEHKYEAEEE
jgi:hypothetical protein